MSGKDVGHGFSKTDTPTHCKDPGYPMGEIVLEVFKNNSWVHFPCAGILLNKGQFSYVRVL